MAHFDLRSATKRDRASDLLALPPAAPVDDMLRSVLCARLTYAAAQGREGGRSRRAERHAGTPTRINNRAIGTSECVKQAERCPRFRQARVEEQI
jgi:hypothetical protein